METTTECGCQTTLDPQVQKRIEFRLQQSTPSKIAELCTGIVPENPNMLDRLLEIQKRIYEKYSLPDISLSITNPQELDQKLNEILKKNQIPILPYSESQDFFTKYPNLQAVYFKNKKGIGINPAEENKPSYNDVARQTSLIHEITHALQDRNGDFEQLSIEFLEFEAYTASIILSLFNQKEVRGKLTTEQIQLVSTRFFENICTSVDAWDLQIGVTQKPHYSAENLLRVLDGISDEQINTFKKQSDKSPDSNKNC